MFLFFVPEVIAQKDSIDTRYQEEEMFIDDPYYWSHTKEIGLNFTSLISKFVPFNLGNNDPGRIGLIYKKYYSTRAFRLLLGSSLSSDAFDNNSAFIYLSLGLEKRHPIYAQKGIFYTSSWDLYFTAAGNDNSPEIGLSKGYGMEYHLNKRLYLSTEAYLRLATGNEGPIIRFDVPIALNLHVRLY